MVQSKHSKGPEASSDDMGINFLTDLLKEQEKTERQINDLIRRREALAVLIKIEQGGTSLPGDLLGRVVAKGYSSKRGMMIETVKLRGRARPKEILAALLDKGVKVDAHYVHNELSALYKSKVLGREKGEYFLRDNLRDKK